jgi:Arc/MetJ-type ribon-helix-helix transcriptional regulator
MSTQLAVKLSESMVVEIDRLIKDGHFANRTDAVRAALDRMLEEIREEQVTAAIVKGYQRIPPDESDGAWAEAATRAMIAEEPWP